ncbi:MAG TPA: competence/damage-inducible protein A [Gemmatimonadaceae bacterium]|nr:competence/damage-inducible protein A [Gemmatimonadaceae bacterium]
MRVEVVTIGDELLLGFTLDSNGAHLARELAAIGVTIARRTSVGDEAGAITAAVREALDRTGAVITTGGLGPTSDDLTKPSIAAVFGRGMRMDGEILEALRQRWIARGWGKALPESNRQQALVPEGATILTNRHGSAPGIWLEDAQGRWVAMLPGVPREMRGMFAEEVLPRVASRAGAAAGVGGAPVVLSRTLRTTGISESLLSDRIRPIEGQLAGLSLAYLPSWPGVDLRLTAQGRPRAESDAELDAAEAAVRGVAGEHIYGTGADDLAAVVVADCLDRGFTIAVAESCTGGLLGGRITAVPGASQVFLGGVIAYANEVKATHLGVGDDTLLRFGAVSEETAREMASGARARFRVDVAAAITGVAGPGGGTPEKPVGTVCVAVDVRGAVRSARRVMVGDREEVRLRSTQWALDMVRRALVSR